MSGGLFGDRQMIPISRIGASGSPGATNVLFGNGSWAAPTDMDAGLLRWTKYTIAHTALQVAGLTNDVELLSLPAGGNIHAIKMRHSAAFGGGLIAGYTLSIGIGGNLIKYMAAASVFGSSAIAVSGTFGCESHSGATSIRLAAVATTGLLNSSTQGSADIWVCTSLIL